MTCSTHDIRTGARTYPFLRLRCEHQRPSKAIRRQKIGCMAATNIDYISDVTQLPKKYKGILLDQFGVLHDGKTAYPGAINSVDKLAADGRRIVILSNSARRSSNTIPRLVKLGFDANCFAGAVTSGELTFFHLKDRPDRWWQQLGNKCLHLTWGERGPVSLEGLNLKCVTDPDEADFVLAHGTEVLGRGDDQEGLPASLEEIKALLQKAADRGLKLVVANPDVVTVSGDSLVPMPGTFARWFTAMGGEVKLMGKPGPLIYEAAMKMMDLAADEVVAVGDSLEHDIAGNGFVNAITFGGGPGANAANVDSVFIAGGIHAEELGILDSASKVDEAKFSSLLCEHSAQPQYLTNFV